MVTLLIVKNYTFQILRWFDKSFQVVVFKNGRFGMNAEHSWADAPIMSHLTEEVLFDEFASFEYNADGTCQGEITTTPLPPVRLKWTIPEKVGLCLVIGSFRGLHDDWVMQKGKGFSSTQKYIFINIHEFSEPLTPSPSFPPGSLVTPLCT